MSTSLATMIRLRAIQNQTRKLFKDMSDINYRLQFHHDLSPAGWHLGHGLFIENYWLHEVIGGDKQFTEDEASLFIPENCPKPSRGPKLPPLNELLEKIQDQQDSNDLLLMEMTPPFSEHALFKDEYIENFIIQHYAQHYETIHMVLSQIAIKKDKGKYQPENILSAKPLNRDMAHIKHGDYMIGGEKPLAYDNELPPYQIHLDNCYIATTPVTNSEFLSFMQDDAYDREELWSKEGWQWCQQNNIHHPEHWKQNAQNDWYAINHLGPYDLLDAEFVSGLSHYEASAFANWAQARLPHEHEWETAARHELIKHTTDVWEWCNNTLFPYPQYQAFPYNEYSSPWFDGKHFVLKAASHITRPEIKRASFRNFYQAHQRHIFAGIRLVFE